MPPGLRSGSGVRHDDYMHTNTTISAARQAWETAMDDVQRFGYGDTYDAKAYAKARRARDIAQERVIAENQRNA